MPKNIECNARIIITPTGKIRLGFVHTLSEERIEKSGPFKGSPYREWENVSAKVRKQIATLLGTK